MKRLLLLGISLAVSVAGVLALSGSSMAAASNERLMDDWIFSNNRTMNTQQIDDFLNQFPDSCISSQSGFAAIEPTGYSPEQGFQYGELVSAGTVIDRAAQAYSINPQVLIAMLQKEQSLVTGRAGCDSYRLASAMGYACPDGGSQYSYSGLNLYARHGNVVTDIASTCVDDAARAGFSQQAIRAAWLLKFAQQRSLGNAGWAVLHGNWNNTDDLRNCYSGPMTEGDHQICQGRKSARYDGHHTINGQSVKMQTGATAALYNYTPHFAGNQLFIKTFENWFGPAITPHYSWELIGQQAFTDQTKNTEHSVQTMKPGERAYVIITVKNTSNYTWSNSGLYPIKLGSLNPRDHDSPFCADDWPSCSRPAKMAQANTEPGQTATFEFWYQAPAEPGVYREHFGLVSEAKSWLPDNGLALETVVASE